MERTKSSPHVTCSRDGQPRCQSVLPDDPIAPHNAPPSLRHRVPERVKASRGSSAPKEERTKIRLFSLCAGA